MKNSYVLKHLLGSMVFFSLIFLSAGKISYWQGWAYVAIGLIMTTLNYTVLRIDKDLLQERSKPGQNTRQWDKAILGLSFLVNLSMYVLAGLDSGRYGWSPDFATALYIAGGALVALGQLLFLVAQKHNRFFSSTVRIQTDRGHQVCDTGLYSFVRHPAYFGSLIQSVGFPLLLGSVWSIIPASVMILILVIRTKLEDRTLKDELKGYSEYSEKTRFRLIPYIW